MKPRDDREPTRDELMAMAYTDDELEPDERREFELRLAREPPLAREVSELKALELVARRAAPPEPKDHEWRRLEAELLHGGGTRLGFALLAVAAVGLTALAAVRLAGSDADPWLKLLLGLGSGGLALLFLLTLRGRLRTRPYDPYTKVER